MSIAKVAKHLTIDSVSFIDTGDDCNELLFLGIVISFDSSLRAIIIEDCVNRFPTSHTL